MAGYFGVAMNEMQPRIICGDCETLHGYEVTGIDPKSCWERLNFGL